MTSLSFGNTSSSATTTSSVSGLISGSTNVFIMSSDHQADVTTLFSPAEEDGGGCGAESEVAVVKLGGGEGEE